MYGKPNYNLLASLWTDVDNAWPGDAYPPNIDNMPCQKYILSKLPTEMTPPVVGDYWTMWEAPIIFRFPFTFSPFTAPRTQWLINCIECPAYSGQFYRAAWYEIMHEGFANAYAVVVSVQCSYDGTALPPYTPTLQERKGPKKGYLEYCKEKGIMVPRKGVVKRSLLAGSKPLPTIPG